MNTGAALNNPLDGNSAMSGSIGDIPMENIERIEYVTGGAATTLYGSDAANGVIQIFTKKGGEGRRVADLGIRLPVCEVEAANTPSAADYMEALIPSFIPLNYVMDSFAMDDDAMEVTIAYNMNRIIVENKASEYVAPFFD